MENCPDDRKGPAERLRRPQLSSTQTIGRLCIFWSDHTETLTDDWDDQDDNNNKNKNNYLSYDL